MEDATPLPDCTLDTLSDASVDLDLMGELLSEDAWLGASDLADLLQPTPFDPSYLPSPFKMENRVFSHRHEGDAKATASPKNPHPVEEEMLSSVTAGAFFPYPQQGTEPGKAGASESWRFGLRATSSGRYSSVKERLNRALGSIKEAHGDGDVLVQLWVPIRRGDRQVLTTYGQPFSLSPDCHRLMGYRNVSTGYQFSAEGDSGEALGLPGRVYLRKLPEWSPDVRYFSRYEYPRVNDAQRYDVRGTLALPVFEQGSRTCLGVIELVMTTERINYSAELEHICSALQAVDLSSSQVPSVPRVKMKGDSHLAALQEISAVLRAVCHTHGLPLAQTWMACIQQGRSGSRHSEENYHDCVSTVDVACFVNDPSLSSFHEACSEHHLLRGQGVVGKAFMINQPCFSSDITTLSKADYPLSHHARMFRLRSAVAIRLRSVSTGKADFVLEFFLPMDCLESDEQKVMLDSLSATMRRVCRTLRVVTPKELEEEAVLQLNEQLPSDGFCQDKNSVVLDPVMGAYTPEPSWVANVMEAQAKEKTVVLPAYASLEFGKQEQQGFSVTNYWGRPDVEFTEDKALSKCNPGEVKASVECGDSLSGEPSFCSRGKATEKKRTRMEKSISLQVLQQYFAGSLKDAAKSIGVCPTTLKRICRQHGITRWPSRKIKKVGHSLRKLQVVINSIQGVDGSFQLGSLYANFPKDSGSDPYTQMETMRSMSTMPNKDDIPESSDAQQAPFNSCPSASNSLSSSYSRSSGSSHCCSSRTKQCGNATKIPLKEEMVKEDHSVMLKRAHSELDLCHSTQQAPKALARSQSLKSFDDNPGCEGLSPSHKCVGGLLRVKAIYGNEKIRFRLQPTWGFQGLKEEIAKRFYIGNIDSIGLKYLDDDSEWVLLTCDADLQECTDIHRSSNIHTIKISVHHAAQPSAISSRSGL